MKKVTKKFITSKLRYNDQILIHTKACDDALGDDEELLKKIKLLEDEELAIFYSKENHIFWVMTTARLILPNDKAISLKECYRTKPVFGRERSYDKIDEIELYTKEEVIKINIEIGSWSSITRIIQKYIF